MDIKKEFDFSDVDAFFQDGEAVVSKAMTEAGQNAVEYAKTNGNYTDRSGTLRKSNKFVVGHDSLTLYNDATAPDGYQYAAKVESRGYDVLGGAALNAEVELQKKFGL